ncbi:MAG: hypothetical protein AAFX99_24140, partial [Myxococcota bacterium]
SFTVAPPEASRVYLKFYNKDYGFDYDSTGQLIDGSRDEDSQVGGIHTVKVERGRASIEAADDANNPGDTYAIVFSDPACSAPLARSGVQP